MDLLNVQEGASRPSLFSSIWSLQVQMQNESNPLVLEMPALFSVSGSQQSLPGALSGAAAAPSSEMLPMCADDCAGGTTSFAGPAGLPNVFRSVKSLSDLKSLAASPSGVTIGLPPPYLDSPTAGDRSCFARPDDSRQEPSTSSAATAAAAYFNAPISRQQRNSNVCAWLQQLSIDDTGHSAAGAAANGQMDMEMTPPPQAQPH